MLTNDTYDMISLGDSGIDAFMFVSDKDADVRCDINKEDCKVCFNYADKVPVEKFALVTAGNSLNQAIGSSRLGMNTAIYTEIGNDNNGKMIVDTLTKEKVSLDYVNLNKDGKTNLHAVISYGGERTIFVYHDPRNYKLPFNMTAPKWIYYSSVSAGFEPFQETLVEFIQKNPDIKVGFNPATYHLKAGLENLRNILSVTTVLFVNKEEAKRLLSIDLATEVSFQDLHKQIIELGPKITVITDGPKGSTVYDGSNFYERGLYDVPIVDRTGVGDSFATGFIGALFHGKSIEEALKWGTINSAGVIQQVGPQAGLQTKQQIEAILNNNPEYTPVNLL